MKKEHKYKGKDEYKDNDKDKDAERITESLTVTPPHNQLTDKRLSQVFIKLQNIVHMQQTDNK